jgi:hypothetical protein
MQVPLHTQSRLEKVTRIGELSLGVVPEEPRLIVRTADLDHTKQQLDRRYAPNIGDINRYCDSLRDLKPGRELPYIDPMHDADQCKIVSLFASPGPASTDPSSPDSGTGFLGAGNNDGSAARMSAIYEHLGLRPEQVMPWNAYPWYLSKGDGKLTNQQLDEGLKPLIRFLALVPRASALVAHGTEARRLVRRLEQLGLRNIRARGFKSYDVHAAGDRAFTGAPAKQEQWLEEMRAAYQDAMARAGIARKR